MAFVFYISVPPLLRAAQGIDLAYEKSGIAYNSLGQAVSYGEVTVQVEHDKYQKASWHGIRKRMSSGERVQRVSTGNSVVKVRLHPFG